MIRNHLVARAIGRAARFPFVSDTNRFQAVDITISQTVPCRQNDVKARLHLDVTLHRVYILMGL